MHLHIAICSETRYTGGLTHRRKKVKMIFHWHHINHDNKNTWRSGVGGLWLLSFKHQNGFLFMLLVMLEHPSEHHSVDAVDNVHHEWFITIMEYIVQQNLNRL